MYVLLEGTDYEGHDLLGVYATREDALDAAREYVANNPHSSIGDWLEIVERELGAPATRDNGYSDDTVFMRGKSWRGTKDKWLA